MYSELVHPDEPEFPALAGYCARVLTALGIDNGVAHSEIMLTRDGPALIETGARVEGACDPAIAQQVVGHSQNSLLVAAYLDPDAFGHAIARPAPRPRRYARHVYLLCAAAGPVVAAPDMDTTLDTATDLTATVNLATCPGNLYLVSDNPEAIEADYVQLRTLEIALYTGMLDPAPIPGRT